MPEPEPIIVLNELKKAYRDTLAVDGVSMAIPRGEIFGFLGANGAGKTTTIRMLCGLVKPTGGSATIAGRDVWRDRYEVRTKFGYVAQKFSLYPDLTVVENLRFFGGAYRAPRENWSRGSKSCWTKWTSWESARRWRARCPAG